MEELHIQPSEIDAFPFFEYEYTLEIYQEILKERKKEQESGETSQSVDKYMEQGKSYQKSMSRFAKTPLMPKLTMPKMPRL